MLMSATEYRFEICQPADTQWDDYVRKHSKGSIFHTSAMIRAFTATRNVEPFAKAAIDESGNIVAMMVSCHVKTLRDFTSLSSRAVQYAEPLCDSNPAGIAALTQLVANHDKQLIGRALMSEVRSICQPGCERDALLRCNYEHRDYINYVVPLRIDPQELWLNVNKRMRQKIRSTLRKEVVLRDDNSLEGIGRLYALLQSSYRRARVPLLGRELFEAALHYLPPQSVRIRTAFSGDRPIAAIISLVFGNRVYSWYGGTLRINGLSPFACIVWDDILWGHENGFEFYDFGGAGWPHEDYGPRKFKAAFGGLEVRHGRYLLTYSKLRLRMAQIAFRVSRRLGAWSGTRPDTPVEDET